MLVVDGMSPLFGDRFMHSHTTTVFVKIYTYILIAAAAPVVMPCVFFLCFPIVSVLRTAGINFVALFGGWCISYWPSGITLAFSFALFPAPTKLLVSDWGF